MMKRHVRDVYKKIKVFGKTVTVHVQTVSSRFKWLADMKARSVKEMVERGELKYPTPLADSVETEVVSYSI